MKVKSPVVSVKLISINKGSIVYLPAMIAASMDSLQEKSR
jgi:hypothetical protein